MNAMCAQTSLIPSLILHTQYAFMDFILSLYRTSIIIQFCRHAKNYNTCTGILLNIRVVISQYLLSIAVLPPYRLLPTTTIILLMLQIRMGGRRDYNVTHMYCDGYGATDEWRSYYNNMREIRIRERVNFRACVRER